MACCPCGGVYIGQPFWADWFFCEPEDGCSASWSTIGQRLYSAPDRFARTSMRFILTAILCLLCPPADISAHPAEETLEELVITGRREHLAGEARSASEGVVGQMDLAIRPLLRPGDVLEAVPGLIVTQHSGCLLYTSPSPRDLSTSRMPSSA